MTKRDVKDFALFAFVVVSLVIAAGGSAIAPLILQRAILEGSASQMIQSILTLFLSFFVLFEIRALVRMRYSTKRRREDL